MAPPEGGGRGGMEGHYIRSCGPRGPVPPHRTVPPAGRSAVQDDVQDITMPARAAAPPPSREQADNAGGGQGRPAALC